jgi:8-oxo-dGTP diphosphatase
MAASLSPDRPLRCFTAVKAFIRHQDKVLLLQESTQYTDGHNTGFYDVPGGRLDPGESWKSGLEREIKEECCLSVHIGRPFHVDDKTIHKPTEDWHITFIFFDCRADQSAVSLSGDHSCYLWSALDDLDKHPVIANLIPVIQDYKNFIRSGSNR